MSVQPDLRPGQTPALTGAADTAPFRETLAWRTVAGWTRRHSILMAVSATLAVHLLSLTRHLGSDEGGFAMVAQHRNQAGGFLYGPQWVDRPPGLIALFATVEHLGPYGVRLGATLVAVLLVGALAWAADAVGGRPAAKWAAWTGFAFASSVLLQAQRLNGELAAAAFVTVSIGATLRAVRLAHSRFRIVLLGMLAGAAATLAALMKQNFIDAFVFAGVLGAAGLATGQNRLTYRPSRVLGAAAAFTVGALLPAAAALVWSMRHGGVSGLAYAVVGFRVDASAVMTHWSLSAPLHRLGLLTVLGCGSGLLLLLVHLTFSHRRRLRRLDPLPWAVAATVSVELSGVLAGGNFWAHYLLALIPMVSLTAGLSVTGRAPGAAWTRRLVVFAVAVTAIASPVAAIASVHTSSAAYTTGRWIADSAHGGDTLVVAYTHANVINASGLAPGYPYAWSLPVRTLDPHLTLLTETLDRRTPIAAPTWVVGWDAAHTWGLDPGNRVAAALHAHYRAVATVCGHTVWLHDGIHRHLAGVPAASACQAGDQ